MFNFEKLLKQNKLAAEGPTTGTKRKIAQFRALETKIANAQNHITTVKSERKKLELQKEIQEAEVALQEMDAEICDGINKFVKNKDVYAANAERLKASRVAKTSTPASADPKPDPAPADDPKPNSKPDPVTVKNTDPAPDPKPTPKPADPAPQPTEKKKSGSALGWVAAAIGLVVAVIVGKNVIENR
jgi:hypothetical protein